KLQTFEGKLDQSSKRQRKLELRAKTLEAIIEDLRRQLKGAAGVKPPPRPQLDLELRAIEDAVKRLKASLQNADKKK
ncbi:MAG: hypothetical protein IIC51_10350, partial [Planctomycetes bacterium]|nr:hypothetical protein [Planctomycetota bacterium]